MKRTLSPSHLYYYYYYYHKLQSNCLFLKHEMCNHVSQEAREEGWLGGHSVKMKALSNAPLLPKKPSTTHSPTPKIYQHTHTYLDTHVAMGTHTEAAHRPINGGPHMQRLINIIYLFYLGRQFVFCMVVYRCKAPNLSIIASHHPLCALWDILSNTFLFYWFLWRRRQ